MSRKTKDRLYNLLPSIYRQQDIAQQTSDGKRALQDLMAIMEDVLETLENDVDGLYENWFIETCSEWVVPYIGDLIGANLLRTVQGSATVSARAYVANTIRYRKRKGTAGVLEEIARDITGYDARTVEFFQFVTTTQNINHPRPLNTCTPIIRNPDPMELVDTAFDQTAHMLDVRRIKNGQGYYNIPNIGIFLWRLIAYPVKEARAFYLGGGKYTFSQIGQDIPLFNHPLNDVGDFGVAEEINVSAPIRRLALKNNLAAYYGKAKSILVTVDSEEVDASKIVVCDLSDDATGNWTVPQVFTSANASNGLVAIDPVLGRLMFPNSDDREVYVDYYYGFTTDMGSGFYQRDLYESDLSVEKYFIGQKQSYRSFSQALNAWNSKKSNAIFEFADSDTYVETALDIQIPANATLVVRSAKEKRATLTVADPAVKITVTGGENSTLVFDGLLLDRSLKLTVEDALPTVEGSGKDKSNLGTLTIQNCTFVPPEEKEANSITVNGNDFLTMSLDRSISGPVYMKKSMGKLVLKDSILDSGSIETPEASQIAVDCTEASIENTTIFGKSNFQSLTYASNVIFTDTTVVKRRQEGCVRFSYIANRYAASDASRMPRCYHCQPETAASVVAPRFTAKNYGHSGYGQLHKRAVKKISQGADNESEMGAFNQAYQAHRINNLLAAFPEYLPFGLEVGIILVT